MKSKLNGPNVFPQFYIELGYNYSLQKKDSEAQQYYNLAIEYSFDKPMYAYSVGKAFWNYNLLDQAVIVYEKAMEMDPKKAFNRHLSHIYGVQGKLLEMFSKYIDLIHSNPGNKAVAQNTFS